MSVPIKNQKCGIIIPGGAGFVGRNLVRVLKSENYDMKEVTVLDKDKSNLDFVKRYGVQTQHVDLAEKGGWYDEPQMEFEAGLKKMQAWFTENWGDTERSAEF